MSCAPISHLTPLRCHVEHRSASPATGACQAFGDSV
jgi:hypothetical protein